MEEKSKNGKSIAIIVILCLLVCGLGGFIVYDKFINSDDKTETKVKENGDKDKEEKETKSEKEEVIDLSNVPEVDSECTIEYSMTDYNSKSSSNSNSNGMTCVGQRKYIINDVVVDGKKIDVQSIEGSDFEELAKENIKTATEEETGFFVNGVKYASLYNKLNLGNLGLKEIFIRDNMLFAHLDGGTYVFGYTDILVFDKNGKQIYKLTDHVQISNNNNISRPTIKVLDDNSISFELGNDEKRTKYIVKYNNGKFEEPAIVNE